jgi:hypothetical protein
MIHPHRRAAYAVFFSLCLIASLPIASVAQTFTDDPLVPGITSVRAVHITELRTRINALRAANGMASFVFTDPNLTGTAMRAVHVTELRTALGQVYSQLAMTAPTFADSAIAPGVTAFRAIHINELRAAVIALENGDTEDPMLSLGVVSLAVVSETAFNPTTSSVRFNLTNAQFSLATGAVRVFRAGVLVSASAVQVTASSVIVTGMLVSGRNEIELLAMDTQGRTIDFGATVWAGTATLTGRVVDDLGTVIPGAAVTLRLGIDNRVRRSLTAGADGTFSFPNVPEWTVLLEATSTNRLATASVRGTIGFVELRARAIGAPSPINNNDFSLGTSGWDVGTAPVQVVQHPGTSGPVSMADFDLRLSTSGQGAQRISRTFNVTPGVKNVTVRYQFITSEVPGGYFGTQYDDSFSVSVRSQTGQGSVVESSTMNSLGLAAFNASGATQWRETTLPVSVSGDVVRVDLSVANVSDGLLDSQLLIDVVAETNLSITELTLNDIDGQPLQFLSGAAHTYFGGMTRIHGTITVKGPTTDALQSLTLEISQGGVVRATASLAPAAQSVLLTSFGATGQVQITSSTLLFQLSSAQAANLVGTADSSLALLVRARSASGKEATYNAGLARLLVRFTGLNRYGNGRDEAVGGDDWVQPGMRAIADHFVSNTYGDFSNMNGGRFAPHAEHRTGDDVDGWFPNYNQRNAATAATIIGHLNDPTFGPRIGRVLVTFDPVDANAFWSAIKNVTLNDGRLARNVIHPAGGHTTHFHWDRKSAASPAQRPVNYVERLIGAIANAQQ